MAQTVSVIVSAEERVRLAAIVGDRSRPLKHVQRARIVLHSADRLPVLEVARRASVSRPAVWRWQRRYAEEGVEGLLHDKTRPPGTAPVPMTTVAKVLALTCAEPPGETTHWTGRAMAAAVGLSLRTIQRIWEAHRLQPHRLRTFKRSGPGLSGISCGVGHDGSKGARPCRDAKNPVFLMPFSTSCWPAPTPRRLSIRMVCSTI